MQIIGDLWVASLFLDLAKLDKILMKWYQVS